MKRKVRGDLAMTGEITLRGRILPIGGLKEKLLAAHRGNLKAVVIPKDNEKDLADVPANVLRALDIVFVEHMDEVLKAAFIPLDDVRADESNNSETLIGMHSSPTMNAPNLPMQ
jgi:ATP-dependent Lon protease